MLVNRFRDRLEYQLQSWNGQELKDSGSFQKFSYTLHKCIQYTIISIPK